MTYFARFVVFGALFTLGACGVSDTGLRLERVVAIAEVELPPTPLTRRDPRGFGGVVAEFSSASDWRRRVARHNMNFTAVIERCAGRTHIEDRDYPRQWINHGDFVDDQGILADAGRAIVGDPSRLSGAEGIPQNGRYYLLLPIHLQGYMSDRPSESSGWVVRRAPDQDILHAPDDLCVFARGAAYFRGVWRSNTVVIPYAAIRAALDASPSPESSADPPNATPR